jgi:TRAP-type C4-dicarboxylate transport system permease small subunit
MAGLNDAQQVRPPGPLDDWSGPLGGFGWSMSCLDYYSYCVEKAITVTAFFVMIAIEFIYILYQNAIGLKLGYLKWSAGEGPFPSSGVALLVFVALLISAVVSHSALGRTREGDARPFWQRGLISAVIVGVVVAFSALCVIVEHSSSFYLLFTFMLMGSTVFYFFMKEKTGVAALLGIVTVFLLLLAANVPEGYSWADKYSLFLMMWMGFLGASMTTKEKSHIKLDVARKLCPERYLRVFNIVSDMVAAVFTGLFFYLAALYLFGEGSGLWYETTLEGELPGWLVVLAIPMALLIITLRLLGRAVATFFEGSQTDLVEEVSP